jgi:anti-sigma regulatory factor (Ser/Thr protein kinase)
MTSPVELCIRNDLSEIGIVRDILDKLGTECGIPMRALMRMQVAVDEILSNVVRYAWPDGDEHELVVHVDVHSGGMDLEIVDDGRPFDPWSVPKPDPPPEGRRPRPGGVGIHMVKQLVDAFAYERIDGHNHTTLSTRCEAGATIQRRER